MIAAIVHYNTPKLTRAAVLSLRKHTPECSVVILDNSDRLTIGECPAWRELTEQPGVRVIDNTRGQVMDFGKWLDGLQDKEPSPVNNYGSAKHCRSVQWLCDYMDEPFLLLDSDVLVRRDITVFFAHPECVWAGEVGENVRRRFGYDIRKVQPFICYLNAPLMRQHGISYFNQDFMWNLTTKKPNHRYDTGAWFYKSCAESGLPVFELPISEYIVHLGHGSWRERQPAKWLRQHRELWL